MPFAPKCLVGLFCWHNEILGSGNIVKEFSRKRLPNRYRRRNHCPVVLCGDVACSKQRFSDHFRIASLSRSHRRNRPHRSRSTTSQPHRVARAKFDGNCLRAWACRIILSRTPNTVITPRTRRKRPRSATPSIRAWNRLPFSIRISFSYQGPQPP